MTRRVVKPGAVDFVNAAHFLSLRPLGQRRWFDGRAACEGVDHTEFPDNAETTATRREAAAQFLARRCAICPVRTECAQELLGELTAPIHTVRGGFDLEGTDRFWHAGQAIKRAGGDAVRAAQKAGFDIVGVEPVLPFNDTVPVPFPLPIATQPPEQSPTPAAAPVPTE